MFYKFFEIQYNYYNFFIIRNIRKYKVNKYLVNSDFRFSSVFIK